LVWFYSAAQRRYELFLKNCCIDCRAREWSGKIGKSERDLAIRSKFLKCYWELAGLIGAVAPFMVILNETLQFATKLANRPDLRVQGLESTTSWQSRKILSGGMEQLSDIMKLILWNA